MSHAVLAKKSEAATAIKAGAASVGLRIGRADDALEHEADRVADQVTAGARAKNWSISHASIAPPLQRKCSCGGSGQCEECEEKAKLQRKPIHSPSSSDHSPEAPPIVHEALRSPGQPLDSATRAFMEPRFRCDFGQIRVHTDTKAAESACSINASAYTIGRDIVFGRDRYSPASPQGRRLLAHELTHTLQQTSGFLQRQDETCPRRFTRARSFSDYISLVREAETRLSAAGYSTAEDRVHVLRGIYYGTEWSADFAVEHSPVRNLGFQTYTASMTPDDPRAILNCGLFEALRDSQDLTDGRKHVDAGHLMIGLDARRSWTARNLPIPTQGGTGLEISTWLGDLGGGAGMLAYHRVTNPAARAMSVFTGTDFGGSINLEGDVAGYVVARDTSKAPSEPAPLLIPSGGTIADALQAYLVPSGGTPAAGGDWNNRCKIFLQMTGGSFDASGVLTNAVALVDRFAGQIQGFACWYIVNRLRQDNHLSVGVLRSASLHIEGVSREVAQIFVDALVRCQSTPGSRLEATGAGPAPTGVGSSAPTACNLAIRALEAAESAGRVIQEGERRLEQIPKLLPF